MRKHQSILVSVLLIGAILMSACGRAATLAPTATAVSPAAATDTPIPPEPTATSEPDAEAASSEPATENEEGYLELNPADFDENSIVIDNEWWPLTPGKQFVYEGSTNEGGVETPHQIIFTVTDLTKVIRGVNAVVIWDRDFSDGELVESELAFFAQDKVGNVWHLGQYRETWEGEEFVGGRAWLIDHVVGAKAGIMMKADPQPGAPSYSQGFAPPPYNWTDRAQTDEMSVETCVPAGCYENVLVTAEFNEEEPDAIQLKYYAPGVGNVRVGWRGDDQQQEILELVELRQLDADGLAEAREAALGHETRAYVYADTAPAQQRPQLEATQEGESSEMANAVPATENEEGYLELNPADFDENSIVIDNEWWPLTPGKQFVYEGSTNEGGVETPHQIIFTVTDLTKVIRGVNAVVIWDRDFSDGELVESELAFFAQDKVGNVWHLGQYRETWEGEEFVAGRAWLIDHVVGAKAGIMMKADPQPGAPSYSQGFAPPPYNWTDRAQTDEMSVETCVPAGCYENVLVTAEFNEEEPDAIQLKYYAPGVGNVRVGWRGDDQQQEILELVELRQLDADGLAEAREAALGHETRAYVYADTAPVEMR